ASGISGNYIFGFIGIPTGSTGLSWVSSTSNRQVIGGKPIRDRLQLWLRNGSGAAVVGAPFRFIDRNDTGARFEPNYASITSSLGRTDPIDLIPPIPAAGATISVVIDGVPTTSITRPASPQTTTVTAHAPPDFIIHDPAGSGDGSFGAVGSSVVLRA